MKKINPKPIFGRLAIMLRYVILLYAILLFNLAGAQTLERPIISFEPSCGAGYVVLTATSEIINDNLTFIWYDKDLEVLGQETGVNGSNEFITPFLTRDESFYVSLELNGQTSSPQEVEVQIIHTPKVLEEPRMQLCGSVTLNGSIELFDTFGSITYQWQKLTAANETEVAFQDIDGETSLTLSVVETGIFRFVVFLDDDCTAISAGVEVTNEQVSEARPEGDSDHCYTVGSTEDDIATFSSGHYRVGITTVEWYRSNDGGATYASLISTDQFASIEKPASIIDTDETWFYRLVVMEQNCSDQEDFVINWNAKPRGSIQHENGSADNFFYCEDDATNTRTLEVISSDNVSVTWYQLLDIGVSKSQLELLSTSSGDEAAIFISLAEQIGFGNEITLDQSMGGLIFARLTDLDNGCVEYSSNVMFADTAFPIPKSLFTALPPIFSYPFNGVCLGLSELTMSSWDGSADNYSWYYSTDDITYGQVGSSSTYTISSIDNPGNVAGFYKLGVEKNGCYAESDPFQIYEPSSPESIIEASGTQFCQVNNVVLSSQNQSSIYSYSWFNVNDLNSSLGFSSTFTPTEAGSYVLEINNIFCTSTSEPFEVIENTLVEAVIEASDTKFCQDSGIVLSSQNQSSDYEYRWFNIDDLGNSLSASSIFNPSEAGSYILELDNGVCTSTSDAVEITENAFTESIIEASSTTFCQVSNIVLSSQNQADVYAYEWYNINDQDNSLSESATFTPTESGIYLLELDNGICSSISSPIEVSQLPIPTANFSTPIEIEESLCSVVQASLVEQNIDDTYQWYQSSSNIGFSEVADESTSDYLITEIGFYFATVTNAGGCQINSDTIHVADLLEDELNYDQVAYVCGTNEEALLWFISAQSNQSYQWLYSPDNIVDYTIADGISDLITYEAKELGYYRLEVTGTKCTLTTDPVEVQAAPGESSIDVVILGKEEACSGTPVTLTGVSGGSESSYTWFYKTADGDASTFTGEQQQTLAFDASDFTSDANPVQEVEVYLGINEGNCSSLSEPIAIQAVKKPDVIVRNEITNTIDDVFICDIRNTEVNLEAFQVPNDRTIDYQWSRFDPDSLDFVAIANNNLQLLNVFEPGIYQCTGTEPGTTCSAVSNALEVSFLPSEISGDSTYCFGSFFEVNVGSGLSSDQTFDSFSYKWYYSSDNVFYTPIDTTRASSLVFQSGDEGINGGYFYYIASFNSCEIVSDTSFVEVDQASVIVSIDGQPVQEKGIPFKVSTIVSQEVDSIRWEPSEYVLVPNLGDAVFTIPNGYSESQIEITAWVSNGNCTSAQYALVNLVENQSLEFSKIITPNGDNYNDIFRVKGLDQSTSNLLRIFDGWGTMIYEKRDYDNSTLQGNELMEKIESGNFYYVFSTDSQTYKGSFYVKN